MHERNKTIQTNTQEEHIQAVPQQTSSIELEATDGGTLVLLLLVTTGINERVDVSLAMCVQLIHILE